MWQYNPKLPLMFTILAGNRSTSLDLGLWRRLKLRLDEESATIWGRKGKRVRKRVKTESHPCDSETLLTPDLVEERAMKGESSTDY